MLAKSNGYFLLELLLTLSIFFITTLTILPLYITIEKQIHDARLELEAMRLLYDRLQSYLINGDTNPYQLIDLGSTKYELTLNLSKAEGCVYYENGQGKKQVHCESFE